MCITCHKKENLKLPIPQSVDLYILEEYITKRDSNSMNAQSTFEYFNKIYKSEYPYNPKQIRRAMINMDELYWTYKKDKTALSGKKVRINNKYTFQENSDNMWVLLFHKGALPKGMQKEYTQSEFSEYIKNVEQIEFQ